EGWGNRFVVLHETAKLGQLASAEVYNPSAHNTQQNTQEDVCVDQCGWLQSLWGLSRRGPSGAFRRKGTRLPSLIRITRPSLKCRMRVEQVFHPRRFGEIQPRARRARTPNSSPDGMLGGIPTDRKSTRLNSSHRTI